MLDREKQNGEKQVRTQLKRIMICGTNRPDFSIDMNNSNIYSYVKNANYQLNSFLN